MGLRSHLTSALLCFWLCSGSIALSRKKTRTMLALQEITKTLEYIMERELPCGTELVPNIFAQAQEKKNQAAERLCKVVSVIKAIGNCELHQKWLKGLYLNLSWLMPRTNCTVPAQKDRKLQDFLEDVKHFSQQLFMEKSLTAAG